MKGPLTYFPKQISSFPWRQPWQSHQRRKGAESQVPEARFASCPLLPAPNTCPAGPVGGGACRDPDLPNLPAPNPCPAGPLRAPLPPQACPLQWPHSRALSAPVTGLPQGLCSALSSPLTVLLPVLCQVLVFFCLSPPQLGPTCSQPCCTVAPALLATLLTSLLGPDHACFTHQCP